MRIRRSISLPSGGRPPYPGSGDKRCLMDTVSANIRVDPVAQPELFVAYAEADAEWVHGFLLPELGLDPRSVLTPRGFTPGAMLVTELERAVESARWTLVVL